MSRKRLGVSKGSQGSQRGLGVLEALGVFSVWHLHIKSKLNLDNILQHCCGNSFSFIK